MGMEEGFKVNFQNEIRAPIFDHTPFSPGGVRTYPPSLPECKILELSAPRVTEPAVQLRQVYYQ